MAVDGVDVVAQPQAGVGDRDVRGRGALGQPGGERAGLLRAHGLLEAEEARGLGLQAAVDPARDEPVVVVAADQHELAVRPQRAPEVGEHVAGQLGRVALGVLAQLEPVAEDHEPVDARHGLEQRRAQIGAAEQVRALLGAEVEIGDDERRHWSGD